MEWLIVSPTSSKHRLILLKTSVIFRLDDGETVIFDYKLILNYGLGAKIFSAVVFLSTKHLKYYFRNEILKRIVLFLFFILFDKNRNLKSRDKIIDFKFIVEIVGNNIHIAVYMWHTRTCRQLLILVSDLVVSVGGQADAWIQSIGSRGAASVGALNRATKSDSP